jgi:hypothetical protein
VAKTAVRGERWWVSGLVLLLCALYFVDPNPRLDFSVFDTRDAESYLALSQSLVDGRGYTRSLDPQVYIPHTTWPPGVPVLLMPIAYLAGSPVDLLRVKIGMIAYGVIGIALAYLYARRLARAPLTRLCVPLFLGLNPYYWQFSRMTDTEMPTIAWALVMLLVTDRVWSKGSVRYSTAIGSGLLCGLGLLIRGSLYGALFLPLVHVFARRGAPDRPSGMAARYLCYALSFVLPFALWLFRNSRIDSSGLGLDGINQVAMILRTLPVDPASPLRTASQVLSGIVSNATGPMLYQTAKSLVPGLWANGPWVEAGAFATPLALGIAAILVALSCATLRTLPMVVMYTSMALLNLVYGAGGMARLWVPVTCLMAMSLPLAAETIAFFRRRAVAACSATVILAAMSVSLVFYVMDHDAHPYHDPEYAALAGIFTDIRDHHALAGNILTPNPHAFGLYTGLHAPIPEPRLGIDPVYDYLIVPTVEWQAQRLHGTLVTRNDVWSVIALDPPMSASQLKERYNCAYSGIPSFAVLLSCLIL